MKKRDNNYKIKESKGKIQYDHVIKNYSWTDQKYLQKQKCYELAVLSKKCKYNWILPSIHKTALYKEKEDFLYYLSILCFKLAMIIQFLFDDLKQLLTSQSLSITYLCLKEQKKFPALEHMTLQKIQVIQGIICLLNILLEVDFDFSIKKDRLKRLKIHNVSKLIIFNS